MKVEQADVTYRLERTGRLELSTASHWRCADCGTHFAYETDEVISLIDAKVQCNGKRILLCPWCRPDSTPFKNGRGV